VNSPPGAGIPLSAQPPCLRVPLESKYLLPICPDREQVASDRYPYSPGIDPLGSDFITSPGPISLLGDYPPVVAKP